jgi:hypothetical protein
MVINVNGKIGDYYYKGEIEEAVGKPAFVPRHPPRSHIVTRE